jgi:Fic family protein
MNKNNQKKFNNLSKPLHPFKSPFLSKFFLIFDKISFNEDDLIRMDNLLNSYSKQEIDWQLEDDLQDSNQMLVSFAVSKAENSNISMKEAENIYYAIKEGTLGNDFLFLKEKLQKKKRLSQSDHDKLEYKNIASAFNYFSDKGIKIKDLNLDLILEIHSKLSLGLDVFSDYLSEFETYQSGKLRCNNDTRVGKYLPVNYLEIKENINELISWLKKNPSIINVFVFHVALYAIHPFKNGNKRVCRLLEYFLLRDLGYNKKDLYSISYYYHKEKERYYKYLLEALIKHNFSYFVSLASEAWYFSVCDIIARVLTTKKEERIKSFDLEKEIIRVIKPLVKRRQANFTKLLLLNKKKVSRQTLSNYLSEAVEKGVLNRNPVGRKIFYSISGDYIEEKILKENLKIARDKNTFIPNNLISYL